MPEFVKIYLYELSPKYKDEELGKQANELQNEEEGDQLFVAGTYTHVTEQEQ